MECTKNIINDGSDFHWTEIETRVSIINLVGLPLPKSITIIQEKIL